MLPIGVGQIIALFCNEPTEQIRSYAGPLIGSASFVTINHLFWDRSVMVVGLEGLAVWARSAGQDHGSAETITRGLTAISPDAQDRRRVPLLGTDESGDQKEENCGREARSEFSDCSSIRFSVCGEGASCAVSGASRSCWLSLSAKRV